MIAEFESVGFVEPHKLTVGEYLEHWLENHAATAASAKTVERYTEICRNHLIPALGSHLLTKLNCLIAVLEVAISKISRSMDLPGANAERLIKIRSNLENTLSICNRAKSTLESGSSTATLPSPARAKRSQPRARDDMTYRDYVELSSIDEYQKFKSLPPIKPEEIQTTDIDRLIDELFSS